MVKNEEIKSATVVIDAPKAKDKVVISKQEIESMVRTKLGSMPENFEKMVVSPLWANRFRVNIFILTPQIGSLYGKRTISDSFFVRMNDDGTFGSSEPKMLNRKPKNETSSK